MKKILLIVLVIISIFVVTGCNKTNIEYVDDKENGLKDVTYRFVGESEHFYFQTGNFYYNDDDKTKDLFLSNFKVKDNVESDAKFSLVVYVGDEIIYGNAETEITENNMNIFLDKKGLSDTIIKIGMYIPAEETEESDEVNFNTLNKNNFKENIKVVGKYCKNNKCELEDFKFDYVR